MPYKDPKRQKQYSHEYYLRRKAEDYDGILRRNRESYRRNREKTCAHQRTYREENPQKRRAIEQRSWEKRKEEKRACNRQWERENPEKRAIIDARRRAREQAVPDTLTAEQAEQLIAAGRAMYPGEELHLDHIVPLSRGGGTTFANMHAIPALVNISKHDSLPEEVYKQLLLSEVD